MKIYNNNDNDYKTNNKKKFMRIMKTMITEKKLLGNVIFEVWYKKFVSVEFVHAGSQSSLHMDG